MTGPATEFTEAWRLADVPAAFAAVVELAHRFGYHACLFGSVVKAGQGRDLDVLMVSLYGRTQDWRGLLAAFGGTVVRRFDNPERSNWSFEIARDGRLYHFIFGRF